MIYGVGTQLLVEGTDGSPEDAWLRLLVLVALIVAGVAIGFWEVRR